MRKVRGLVVMGDVNPEEDVNPYGEECEPLNVNPCEPRKSIFNYDIHPAHKSGCVCMLCAPEKWPDLKVEFEKAEMHNEKDRVVRWNYDIHPAHAQNCDCMCCLGGATGKDGKFKLIKEMLVGL